MSARLWIWLLAGAAASLATSRAFAQSAGEITIVSEPACLLTGTLQAVTVTVGSNGSASADNGGSAGRVTILCNSGGATIAIGSDAMVTDAVIEPSETELFTRQIDFAAYAQVPGGNNVGFRLASRPGVNGAWQSATLNAADPLARRLELDISATGFAPQQAMPVAGRYRGRICITINPIGQPAPSNAQGSAGCPGG